MTHDIERREGHRSAGTEDLLGPPRPDEHQPPHDDAERDPDRPFDQNEGDRVREDGTLEHDRGPDEGWRDETGGFDARDRVHDEGLRDETGGFDARDRVHDEGLRDETDGFDARDRMPDEGLRDETGELDARDRVHEDGVREDSGVLDDQDRTLEREPGVDDELRADGQLRDGEQLPDGLTDGAVPGAVEHAPPAADQAPTAQLFAAGEVEGMRARWMELQAAFVDEPRSAVQRADQLVAEVMQSLAAMFARNKQELEGQWQREGTIDTEDLRQLLRRYRAFFDQLLRG